MAPPVTASQTVVATITSPNLPTVDPARARMTLERVGKWLEEFGAGAQWGTVDLQTTIGTSIGTGVGSSATLTFASVAAGEVVAINGVRFIAVSGTPIRTNGEFKVGVSNTADAADLVTTINASSLATAVSASAASGVVTVSSQGVGLCQNGILVETLGAIATATLTPSGVAANDTFTVNGVTFTAEQEMARGTLTIASGVAGDTAVVAGIKFTCTAASPSAWAANTAYVAGNVVVNGANTYVCVTGGTSSPNSGPSLLGAVVNDGSVVWSSNTYAVGASDTNRATNLAAAINAATAPVGQAANAALNSILTASSAAGVVKLRAVASGTVANAYTLVGSANITASGATLTGGLATSNNKLDYGDTAAQTISEVLRAVAASTSALVSQQVVCTSTATLVNVYALPSGPEGNCVTLAGTGGFTASAARLAGGAWAQNWGAQATGTWTASTANGTVGVTLNGVAITVTAGGGDTATATALAAAIAASTNALVQPLIYASSSGAVVTITASNAGVAGNAITLATAGAGTGQSVSGARLTGGAVPTHIVLGGTGVVQSPTIAGARLAGGAGLAGNGGANASAYVTR